MPFKVVPCPIIQVKGLSRLKISRKFSAVVTRSPRNRMNRKSFSTKSHTWLSLNQMVVSNVEIDIKNFKRSSYDFEIQLLWEKWSLNEGVYEEMLAKTS